MKRRILCLILAAVMLLGLAPLTSLSVSADDEVAAMTISDKAIEVLKEFEGFHEYAYYDYGQWTIGYGTACGENDFPYGINKEHAEVLMRKEVAEKEDYVLDFMADFNLTLEQHQFDALVLFTYNLGQGWMNADGDFRQSVIDGDTGNDFIYNIARWCKAGGTPLISLLERRLCEADMYLNGNYTGPEDRNQDLTYVLFDSNGGSLSVLMQGYDADDATVVRPVPYKTDYRFLGWYTMKNGGVWVTTLDYSTSEKTLYAHWQKGEGATDAAGNVLGTTASYRYPAASIASLSIYQTPSADAKVTGTVSASTTLSIVADYVDDTDVKWGKLSGGGWVKLGGAVADTVVSEEKPVLVTVTNSFVNVRQEAGVDSDKVGTLDYGDQITIYKTTLVDGKLWGKYTGGWVSLEYTDYNLALDNEEMPVIANGVVVANSYLRIRKGPGTSYAEVGKLLPGDEISIKQIKKVGSMEWARIEKGWVSMNYVQIVELNPEQPEDTDTPTNPGESEDNNTPGETVKPGTAVLTGRVINTDQLRVRTGAGTGNKEVMRLKSGTKVTIYEQTVVNNMPWGRIDQGWVCLYYVQLDVTADNLDNVVTGTVISNVDLKVRSGAGTNNPKVTSLPKGTKVTIYESTTVKNVLWGRIDMGWICLDYVQLDAALPGVEEKPETPDTDDTQTPTEPEELPEGVLYSGTVINTDELRVRTGAGTKHSEVTRLTSGTKLNFYEETTVNGVLWGKTDLGWVCMTYIKVNPSAEDLANAVKGVVVSNSNLNVRANAGTRYMKVNSLPTGTEVMVYETTKVGNSYWGRIDQGWVCMDYIQIVVEEPETPTDPEAPDGEQGETETPGGTTTPSEPEDTTTPSEPEEPETLPEGALYSGTVINTDELRVRTDAGTNHKEVTRLKMGTKVYIYEEATVRGYAWGRTDLGWVCMTYIQINPTAEDLANAMTGVVVAPNGMNVRSKPGAWNQQVGRLSVGAEVQIYEITEVNGVAWGRTEGGWVCMTYIQLVETEPEIPETEAPEDEKTETPEDTNPDEDKSEGSGTTETPEGGNTDKDTTESAYFEYTHAEYADLINESIKETGFKLMCLYDEDGLAEYALIRADYSDTKNYLTILFSMGENSDKVEYVDVALMGSDTGVESSQNLLKIVTQAAMMVANPEFNSEDLTALHSAENKYTSESDGYIGYADVYDDIILIYTSFEAEQDDPETDGIDESCPAMSGYLLYKGDENIYQPSDDTQTPDDSGNAENPEDTNGVTKETAIEEENSRHNSKIAEIEGYYDASISVNESTIDSLKSQYGISYVSSKSYYNNRKSSIQTEITNLTYKRAYSDSAVERARLQKEIDSLSEELTKINICLQIVDLEEENEDLESQRDTAIAQENRTHQQNLADIEAQYS